jgi:hypothetical protein
MRARGYANGLDELPVVQQWIYYLKRGGSVEGWLAYYWKGAWL